ncbi:hypothetical protein [Methylobacterium oxalidis]|uniref:Uncharacterized protein n=1 Tax=Methylobacterium oxalidis TaxID=944322 RepID=A0A512J673_9HYPH|nr:hypothetical protein [Methylobacterium oxalidis]GEP05471.1 hypothetical protein MOX02_35090 [Methylobacterium oxalidis]GJE35048.1 hypothetical protein LDDCCGHA_5266 [Methylobacterium oxalidis]GLS63048.1 hypothetical protein GCM10007888_14290 [Methylobacterium oxalidis]
MPSCSRFASSSHAHRPGRGRVELSRYVRIRAVPPRAANDNRTGAPQLWRWAIALGTAPTLAVALALSFLI